MNSLITTLPPPAPTASTTTILNKNGFGCSLITLAPGDETPPREAATVDEHVLFVIEGEAAVRFGDDVTTMLSKEAALLVPKGKAHVIAAHSGSWTKLLRVEIPPRAELPPLLVSCET